MIPRGAAADKPIKDYLPQRSPRETEIATSLGSVTLRSSQENGETFYRLRRNGIPGTGNHAWRDLRKKIHVPGIPGTRNREIHVPGIPVWFLAMTECGGEKGKPAACRWGDMRRPENAGDVVGATGLEPVTSAM